MKYFFHFNFASKYENNTLLTISCHLIYTHASKEKRANNEGTARYSSPIRHDLTTVQYSAPVFRQWWCWW